MEESSTYPPPPSSAPSTIQDHQTPIQAHYSNIPGTIRNKPSTSFQIPIQPNTTSSSSSSLSVANLTHSDSDEAEKQTWIRQWERRTKSNYEVRVKEANNRRELEYFKEKEKNDRLKAEHGRTEEKIRKLKAYYLECLAKGKFQCLTPKSENVEQQQNNSSLNVSHSESSTPAPFVTVKSEIVLDENVIVKEEQS